MKNQPRNLLFCLFSFLLCLLSPVTAFATNGGSDQIVHAISGVSNVVIIIGYGFIVLVFIISILKSGISAQLAMQFGSGKGLSKEMMMAIEAIFIFVLAILIFPIAKGVINTVISTFGAGRIVGDDLHFPGT